MLKRVAIFSVLALLACAGPSIAGEPLQLKLFVSKRDLHLDLTNVSDKPVKVLPYFRYSAGDDPTPVALRVLDAHGEQQYLHYTVDWPFSNIRKKWKLLRPGESKGSIMLFSELAEGFRFRKEKYSIIATYHGKYYSTDGAAHDVTLVSNTIAITSDVDVDKVYCDSHLPDGRARFPGGLDVPRQAIEMHCPVTR